ncbi:MAG: nucleoside-diphosphate kinase [Anaerolineales bacterium]|nr:nucleoside-diphosphate kinase [Anaerolineales bacterium]MCB9128463.1 nucleoside-diphosphate kinase [Ardenticatenales bacterium]
MERTLIIVKPDGVQRGLTGEIISRFERRGLKVVALKMLQVDRGLAEEHYAVHKGRPFYDGLIEYIVSAPVVVMALEGKNAVKAARQTIGATNPLEAAPGTIRGDYGMEIGRNLIHGSDSVENGETELALWFSAADYAPQERPGSEWIYE